MAAAPSGMICAPVVTTSKKAPATKRKPRAATANTKIAKKPRAPRKKKAVAAPVEAAPEIVDLPVVVPPAEVIPAPAPTTVIIQTVNPETLFHERHAGAAPPRPLPARRRGVFFDVENTSRPSDVERVLDHLGLDFSDHDTEFFAVGNWRVVGHETARLLASRGARLVHSAPAVGVRDWSDLRIAVSAGVWLAAARPGDMIQIVSDDQAFDAVGDVAMSLGVSFDRLSYRRMAGSAAAADPIPAATGDDRRDSRGRRRRRPGSGSGRSSYGSDRNDRSERPRSAAPPPRRPAPAPVAVANDEDAAQAASEAEIVGVIHDLLANSPNGISLDALTNALKAAGHRRPPGSLRLVTRLRRIKSVDFINNNMIRLHGDDAGERPAPPPRPAPPVRHHAIEFDSHGILSAERDEPRGSSIDPEHDDADDAENGEGGEDGGDETAVATGDQPATGARRRRRRGGRRRRGRGRGNGQDGASGEGGEHGDGDGGTDGGGESGAEMAANDSAPVSIEEPPAFDWPS